MENYRVKYVHTKYSNANKCEIFKKNHKIVSHQSIPSRDCAYLGSKYGEVGGDYGY